MSERLLALLAASSLIVGNAAHAQTPPSVASMPRTASTTPLTGCQSSPINTLFNDFGRTGKMPPELGRWLNDPQSQIAEPYQAFDNVYNVGICWVSAWLVKTSAGPVLIDSLYEPFTDQLIDNLKKVGVDPADIKMVLLTHGHFDHVGGVSKLKTLTNAKLVMSQEGWREARANAQKSQGKPGAWTMPAAADIFVIDGDVLTVGDTRFYVYETPGHTWGTISYALDVKDGDTTYRAITIGGLGLNAIDGAQQVEAYISSVDRIKALVNAARNPVSVHLTAHPFSNGLTENKERLKTRKPGQPHPLVDSQGLIKQLDELRVGATERLAVERSNIAVSANTSAADIALATARELAGDDPYLKITQALLCHELGPDGKPVDAGPDEVNAAVPPTRIFDNLYYIGGTRTGSWLITTPAGYIMIDAMYGDSPKAERPPQEREWVGPPAMDMVGEDGDTITLGGTTVRIFFTPRTVNGGGLSFIVPVFDQGKPHVWATYGNTGAPASAEDRAVHRASVQLFQRELKSAKVDAITSSHPFVDGSNRRISTLLKRQRKAWPNASRRPLPRSPQPKPRPDGGHERPMHRHVPPTDVLSKELKMQTLSIAAAPTTIEFAQARKQAIAKACETMTEPVIVAWKDDTTGKSAPAIPGGSADRWHDYGENNDGTLELKVGDDFHFIFTESSAFDEPDMNLTSLDDNGTKFLCLNGACTEADRQGQGYFAGGGLGG